LPGNIVQLKVDTTNKRANLIAAQERLLAAQRAYDADVAKIRGVPVAAGNGLLPDASAGPPPAIPGAPPLSEQDVRRGRAPTPAAPAAAEPVPPAKTVVAPQTPVPRPPLQPGQCRPTCGPKPNCEAYCSCYETCRSSQADAETCDASCKPILR
jgi:hypothetical protein